MIELNKYFTSVRVLCIIFLTIVFTSCKDQTEENNYCIISGKLKNAIEGSLTLRNANDKEIREFVLSENGSFRDSIDLTDGYYFLEISQYNELKIYLKNGFDLNISGNAKKLDKTTSYIGQGSIENSYLAERVRFENAIFKKTAYNIYGAYNEEAFLQLVDSVYTKKESLLQSYVEKLDENFRISQEGDLKYEKENWLLDYPGARRYVLNDNAHKVSQGFPNPFSKPIDLENDLLLQSREYTSFITRLFQKKTREKIKASNKLGGSFEYYAVFWEIVKKEVSNKNILEYLAYSNGGNWLQSNIKLDSILQTLKRNITKQDYMDIINEVYKKHKKIERGQYAPNFELKDLFDKTVSLEDLRGKLVYIDLWGTMCKPCFKQMPYLRKIEEHFKDNEIHFVGIGMDPTDNLWRKRIKQFEMIGIQLRSESRDYSFLKHFEVVGIPRYILLDRQGKIIDAYAKEPTDPKIIDYLQSYLNLI